MTPERLELYRGRWRRVRRALHLVDPTAESFATGGLGRLMREPNVRLLVLPPDPETVMVEFDAEFWAWWEQPWQDPAAGQTAAWGHENLPTIAAAVRREAYGDEWYRYLALHRHGGIEAGLGRDGAWQTERGRGFRLTTIVGRVWAALDVYRLAVERFGLIGPWEVSLALRATQGAILGNFGTGWSEPGEMNYRAVPCPEPNVLLRCEAPTWPDADGVRDLAWRFGGWIEDTWGFRQRRFLACRGDQAGQFDVSSQVYRWD